MAVEYIYTLVNRKLKGFSKIIKEGKPNIILLHGISGSGKTTFLKSALADLNVLWLTSEDIVHMLIDSFIRYGHVRRVKCPYICIEDFDRIKGKEMQKHACDLLEHWKEQGKFIIITATKDRNFPHDLGFKEYRIKDVRINKQIIRKYALMQGMTISKEELKEINATIDRICELSGTIKRMVFLSRR